MQHYDHEFVVDREGDLNAFACFLFVDFGVDSSSKRRAVCDTFPFGDDRLKQTDQSMSLSSWCQSTSYASNWRNPILVLPQPARVIPGDVIKVRSIVRVDTTRPSYSFSVTVQRPISTGATGQVRDQATGSVSVDTNTYHVSRNQKKLDGDATPVKSPQAEAGDELGAPGPNAGENTAKSGNLDPVDLQSVLGRELSSGDFPYHEATDSHMIDLGTISLSFDDLYPSFQLHD